MPWFAIFMVIINVAKWLYENWDKVKPGSRDEQQVAELIEWADAIKQRVGTRIRYGSRDLEHLLREKGKIR